MSHKASQADKSSGIMFHSQKKSQHHQESNEPLHTESKIEELKSAIGALLCGRSLKYCSEACLRGYLVVNNWNVEKAKKMLEDTLKWRSSYKPEEIRWHEVEMESQTGIMYRANFLDRQGRTVLILRPGLLKTGATESKIRHQVYLMENAVLNFPQGQEQMTWLVDYSGWSWTKNVPIKLTRESITIIQNHYPERLALAIIYNPPRIFEAFWKIVKQFLNKTTFEKVKFVYPKSEESLEAMKSYFDLENLPIEFGGRSTSNFNYQEYSRLMVQDDLKSDAFWGIHHKSSQG